MDNTIKKIYILTFLDKEKDMNNLYFTTNAFIGQLRELCESLGVRFGAKILEQDDRDKRMFRQNIVFVYDTNERDLCKSIDFDRNFNAKIQPFFNSIISTTNYLMSDEELASDLVIDTAREIWSKKFSKSLTVEDNKLVYR